MDASRKRGLADGLDEAWGSYRARVRAELIERRGHGPLGAAAATEIARAVNGVWDDPGSPCGAWLARLGAADARAAARVRDAVRDLSFAAVPHAPARPTAAEVAAVTVGVALALGAGSVALLRLLGLGASVTSILLATLIGGLLAWSVASGARSQALSRVGGDLLHAYLEQLDELRATIERILSDAS